MLTLDGDLFALEVVHVAQEHFFPVAAVADEAQVREGALRRPHLLLHLRQQVAYTGPSSRSMRTTNKRTFFRIDWVVRIQL